MKKRVIAPQENRQMPGNRKLQLVDPFALALWSVIFLVTGTLAVVFAVNNFSAHWYGDVLSVLDWIIGILALINLFATLAVGVRVTDGVADLGRDGKGERSTFDVSLLQGITVVDAAGNTLPETARSWRNANLKFQLTDGTARLSRTASVLTRRQLRAARRFFGLADGM